MASSLQFSSNQKLLYSTILCFYCQALHPVLARRATLRSEPAGGARETGAGLRELEYSSFFSKIQNSLYLFPGKFK